MCSDVAVKQMILSIDEKMPCIVMDQDETHVLVNGSMVDQLLIMLETEVCYDLLIASLRRIRIRWICNYCTIATV